MSDQKTRLQVDSEANEEKKKETITKRGRKYKVQLLNEFCNLNEVCVTIKYQGSHI